MSEKDVATLKIVSSATPLGYIIINEADFDEKVHKPWSVPIVKRKIVSKSVDTTEVDEKKTEVEEKKSYTSSALRKKK